MKLTLTSAVLAIMLTNPAISARIDLDTAVTLETPAGTDGAADANSYDSVIDGPLQYISVTASHSTADFTGQAGSGVDLTLGALRARVQVEKAPGGGEARPDIAAMTTVNDTYHVSGSGKAFAAFTIYGDIASTTDIGDPGQFLKAFGAMSVTHNGDLYLANFGTQNPGDAFEHLANGSYNRKLVVEFDVNDGDTFDVIALIQAEVLFGNLEAAAFDFDVDVKAGLRVYGENGATITPSPVPLPASALLLAMPLAGLMGLRRRKAKTA